MQVTRVHLLNDEQGQVMWMDTTWGSIDIAIPIPELMAKCLAVDIHNQVVDGRGRITPTPWGWCWHSNGKEGRLPVPSKLYYAHYPYGDAHADYPPIAYSQSERR